MLRRKRKEKLMEKRLKTEICKEIAKALTAD